MADKLRVTQVKSTISHIARNRATIRALGLKRIGHTVEIPDNPATQRPNASALSDTVQAGSPALDPGVLHPYELRRELTMTRGDTVRPFGRQSETLSSDTLEDRPVLLHMVTFDTPNALTVDSSWVDPATLSPIRTVSRSGCGRPPGVRSTW